MKRDDERLSRRGFLKRATMVSLGTLAAGAVKIEIAEAQTVTQPPHGAELRGMSLPATNPSAEGRFGYMLKGLPAHVVTKDDTSVDPISNNPLRALGSAMLERQSWPGGNPNNDINDQYNENPNPWMTAGVTFLGQFIDHDITFDSTPLSEQLEDPEAATSFRTPRYDLDPLYGRGPLDDHQFYQPNDRAKFLIVPRGTDFPYPGTVTDPTSPVVANIVVDDLPRNSDGTAIIGDRRNDQTMIIAQLHVAFMKFHNKLVDYVRSMRVPSSSVFESARRLARWHYQWMVIHDFLPRIVGDEMFKSVYQDVPGKPPIITMKYYRPTNKNDRAFIPLEFSVAAYRFGHSLARPRYTIRDINGIVVKSVPLFSDDTSIAYDNKLNGGRPIPPRLKIQWSRFFDDPFASTFTAKRTRQIDARLSAPLHKLPANALPETFSENLLAVRNLLRGERMKLPSGQEVARRMGLVPLTNEQLGVKHSVLLNKETFLPLDPLPDFAPEVNGVSQYEFDEAPDTELEPIITHPFFNGEAPLWFYILKEAELIGRTQQLGPVGGRIVAETLVGLLQRDPNSYLYLNPGWKPSLPLARKGLDGKMILKDRLPIFEIYDLLNYAGAWKW